MTSCLRRHLPVRSVGVEQKSELEVVDVGDADKVLAHVERKRVRRLLLANVQERLVDHKPGGKGRCKGGCSRQ